MGWRTIYVEEAQNLSLYLDNIKITDGEQVYMVPIADVDMLLIDNYKLYMTVQLMCKLSENNVGVVICNKKRLPELMLNPLTGNYAAFKMQEWQLLTSLEFRGELWQAIVQGKISNQAEVLKRHNDDAGVLEKLTKFMSEVEIDDIGNREGLAAKLYFHNLYGDDFIRDADGKDSVNLALNYGYAIVRAAVARAVIAKGFIPTVGIHHRNIYNHFNLADDFIEPYRPLIDEWVYENMLDDFFVREKRLALINSLNRKILLGGKKYSILKSIPLYLDSIVRCYQAADVSKLLLPGSEIVEECE